ncbi:hypothetical protein D0T66_08690 [Dysgonomonas sp. 25]|nr:hypothetical protein [Dysgonomonas sp. 25]
MRLPHTHTHTHTEYNEYFGLIQGFREEFSKKSYFALRAVTSCFAQLRVTRDNLRTAVRLCPYSSLVTCNSSTEKYACVNVRGISGCDSRGHLPPAPSTRGGARGNLSVNSYQSTVNKINVGAKHRSAKRRRAKNLSPAISDIYGAMFIAPYKAITRSLVVTRDDKASSLMLPRLLRRGYDCIFQEVTLVKRYLAKALFELTLRDLHLKVEAIKKDIHACVRPQIDISGRHIGLPLHKNRKRSLVSTRDDNNRPPLSPKGGNGFTPPFNKKREYILLLASHTGRFGRAKIQSNLLFTSSFLAPPLLEGAGGGG